MTKYVIGALLLIIIILSSLLLRGPSEKTKPEEIIITSMTTDSNDQADISEPNQKPGNDHNLDKGIGQHSTTKAEDLPQDDGKPITGSRWIKYGCSLSIPHSWARQSQEYAISGSVASWALDDRADATLILFPQNTIYGTSHGFMSFISGLELSGPDWERSKLGSVRTAEGTVNYDSRPLKIHYQIYNSGQKGHYPAALLVQYYGDDPYAIRSAESLIRSINWDKPRFNSIPKHKAAALINQEGIYQYTIGLYREALKNFRKATAIVPEDQYYYANIGDSLESLGQVSEALAHLAAAPEIVTEQAYFQKQYALMAARHGYSQTVLNLLEDYPMDEVDDDINTIHINALIEYEAFEKAEKIAKDYFEKHDSGIDDYLNILILQEKTQEVIKLLDVSEIASYDHRRIDALIELKRYDEALAALEETPGQPDVSTILYRVKALIGLDQWEESQAILRQALLDNPENYDIHDWLEYVEAELRQGGQDGIDHHIIAAPFPPELIERLAKTEQPPLDESDSAWNQFFIHSERWTADKGSTYSRWRRIHILDQRGAERFNTMTFTFDSSLETIGIDLLEVRDTNGQIIAHGDPKQWYVNDIVDTETDMYDRELAVPIPGVSPGTVIDIRVTWQEKWGDEHMPFTRRFLQPYSPTAASALILDIPETIQVKGLHGVKEIAHESYRLFEPESLINWRWEKDQTAFDKFTPMVIYGDTSKSWAEIGQNYHQRLASLLSDHGQLPTYITDWNIQPNQEQTISNIAAGVQNLLSYRALPFGDRGVIPEPTDSILNARWGDCKEHSLLIHQGLQIMGEQPLIALVDVDDQLHSDFPSMDQFDHMIVYVPEANGPGYWLDATNKDAYFDQKAPNGLGGKQALLLDGANSRLVTIPQPHIDDHGVTIKRHVHAQINGDLKVTSEILTRGYLAESWRNWFIHRDDEGRISGMRNYLSGFVPELEVNSVASPDTSIGDGLLVQVTYTIPDAFHVLEHQLVGRLPNPVERQMSYITPITDRRTPWEMIDPLAMTSTTTLTWDDGLELVRTPSADQGKGTIIAHQTTVEQTNSSFTLNWSFSYGIGVYEAETWQTLSAESEAAQERLRSSLVFNKTSRAP